MEAPIPLAASNDTPPVVVPPLPLAALMAFGG